MMTPDFKFVRGERYKPEPGEVRFDMFDADFTHEGDLCTFRRLKERLEISERGLRPIAEIVHDIDLKETRNSAGRKGRALPGHQRRSAREQEDNDRLERGTLLSTICK